MGIGSEGECGSNIVVVDGGRWAGGEVGFWVCVTVGHGGKSKEMGPGCLN
jgi:hypothetical protein